MAAKQRRLATLAWIAAGAILLGGFVMLVFGSARWGVAATRFGGVIVMVSGAAAVAARAASRRARLIEQGEDLSDLDLDF
jgi:hypothetical protein